jgi:uncharacterized protein YdiU (UPF0061 family)
MSLLSIAVDRRAFMVSSMAYVLYAISNILKTYGDIGYNFALTGDFDAWIKLYDKRIAQEDNPNRIEMIKSVNPKYILRNYLAEVAIHCDCLVCLYEFIVHRR